MRQQPGRIQYLDLMRGFAVVLMVMGHSIDSVLSLEARTTELFRLYDAIRGFTAPLFLFVSGYAFSIATEKSWQNFLSVSSPLVKRLGKIVLLLLVGYVLHFPFFSFDKLLYDTRSEEYTQFFQVDVLHCVAISLILLHLIIFLTRTPRAFALTTLGIAAAIILSTPIVWSINFAPIISPVVSPFLNQKQLSIFPLFPYAAFLLAGTATGHFYLAARRTNKEREFFRGLVRLSIVAGLAGLVFDLLPLSIYPPHDYWKASPNFFLIRIGIILLITTGFYAVQRIPPLVVRQLAVLGQASLFVYIVHLVAVYGSAANNGLMQVVGQTLVYHEAFVVASVVLLAMIALVHLWNYLRTHHYFPARFAQLALAGTLLFYFFTKPY
jgi:uncharacterized membrane protein